MTDLALKCYTKDDKESDHVSSLEQLQLYFCLFAVRSHAEELQRR